MDSHDEKGDVHDMLEDPLELQHVVNSIIKSSSIPKFRLHQIGSNNGMFLVIWDDVVRDFQSWSIVVAVMTSKRLDSPQNNQCIYNIYQR